MLLSVGSSDSESISVPSSVHFLRWKLEALRIEWGREEEEAKRAVVQDLGIGVKVAGGVQCDKCGRLHAVITDVQENIHTLFKGMRVGEWCGRGLDGCSHEEVRALLLQTETEEEIEVMVTECSTKTNSEDISKTKSSNGISLSPEHASTGDEAESSDRNTPPTDKENSVPSQSSTPSHSPSHTHTVTTSPSHAAHSEISLRNVHVNISDTEPRPASINIPAFRSQGNIVKPKVLVNDITITSPSCTIVGPLRKYTIDSFQGGVPTASIEISLRYRQEDGHLRILLHSVKPKKEGKDLAHGSCFINTYLIPDDSGQGVRASEVLSHVSDLENPPCYNVPSNQLECVALRVVLWESKGKNSNFIGEVLLSLADSDVVKLQGYPSWYPVCPPDPNLPSLPKPVPVKKRKRDDLLHIVRTRTGQALQTFRRPVSASIDMLGLEGVRLSPSSSMESLHLKEEIRNIRAADVTIPRRRLKKRRPISDLFTNPAGTPRGSSDRGRKTNSDLVDSAQAGKNTEAWPTSISVPVSPLLRRGKHRDSGRKKKLAGILSILRGSQPPVQGIDVPDSSHTEPDLSEKNCVSRSVELKRRFIPISPLSTSATSSPFTSPIHRRTESVPIRPNSTKTRERGGRGRDEEENETSEDTEGALRESAMSVSPEEMAHSHGSDVVMDSLKTGERSTHAMFSDSSWYSAEEEVDGGGKGRSNRGMHRPSPAPNGATVANNTSLFAGSSIIDVAAQKRSRSADDLLDLNYESEREAREYTISEGVLQLHAHHLERDSSASSVEYTTADSGPVSTDSSCDDVNGPVESTLDAGMRKQAVVEGVDDTTRGETPLAGEGEGQHIGNGRRELSDYRVRNVAVEELPPHRPALRWRSFDDLLDSLPLKKLKRPAWFRRNRSHGGLSLPRASPRQLRRRGSVPVTDPSVGEVRIELTYNSKTSTVGVRLHEHTLSTGKGDLTVRTNLFPRAEDGGSAERQTNTISFRKTYYTGTLVASFRPIPHLHGLSIQVSLETGGRFFNRHSGHVVLDLSSLPISPSHPCNDWFPLYSTPQYPHNE